MRIEDGTFASRCGADETAALMATQRPRQKLAHEAGKSAFMWLHIDQGGARIFARDHKM